MLTPVARAALRRVLTRAPVATTNAAARILPIRSALHIRSFTSSTPTWEAAEVEKAPKAKKAAAGAKTTAKKSAAKKKKKVAAKKTKKVVKKKKVVVKPKKLTPEEKEADRIKQLKKLSLLKEPKNAPISPWLLYIARNQKAQPSSESQKAIAQAYHDLSASEMAELHSTVASNKVANHAQHVEWVESYPPETIFLANLSRRELSRKTGKNLPPIEDARLPKTIRSPFNFYIAEGLKGRGQDRQRFSEIASAWKTMSAEEKRPFDEMAEAEKTLITRQREEIMAKVKELKRAIKEEQKSKPSRSSSRKSKVAATNELGL